MIYLTYNDLPSGIYYSQVTDVCSFLKKELNVNIRLVAFISIRGYLKNRKKIKTFLPDAIVLPMVPKHRYWKRNVPILKFVLLMLGKQKAICRGVFTTNMALKLKEEGRIFSVVFDARGAYKAEFEEYLHKIVHLNDSITELEKKAVIHSDFRLAVSQKLVDYWQQEYEYKGNNHVVIPCTLNSSIHNLFPKEYILEKKLNLGYNSSDILLLYSGSTADWQSIEYIDGFLLKHLQAHKHLKIILLATFNLSKLKSYLQFPDRIVQKWVNPEEVHDFLSIADYGLLIREPSLTNKVASPTKFSEYLNAGLKVIISPTIGDFVDYVIKNNAGIVYEKEDDLINIEKIDYSEKIRMNSLAASHFTKPNYKNEYHIIINQFLQ